MADYKSQIEKYREKKEEIFSTHKTKDDVTLRTRELKNVPVEKTGKREKYSNAYRQILATDFDSTEWIGKEAPLRKHRKNINSNYKSLTGRKWGLSGAEQLKRKGEFETRRDISLKASMALEEFIGKNSEVDPDPADENVLKSIEETDLSQFVYRTGGGTKSVVESDADFVSGFAEQMSYLHGASLLYNKLLRGDNEVSPELMMKLSRMNEMRQAYEDRIRIISSPYYVSLREADFDKSTKEKLKGSKDADKMDANLRSYAKTVLRWQEGGKKLLAEKKATVPAAPAEQVVQDDSVLSDTKTYESDQAVDKAISKVNGRNTKRFNMLVNGEHDQAMAFTKEWVYSSLKTKVKDNELVHETERMKTRLREELADPAIKKTEKKNKEKLLRHLDRVTGAFAAKKISSDVMRIWLDRCLQHRLSYSREIYLSIVHQGVTLTDEEGYFQSVKKVIDPYMKELDGGVLFAQSTYDKEGEAGGVFQNEKDVDESEEPAKLSLRRGIKKTRVFQSMGNIPQKSTGDFIHINGKNADPHDVSTRAYISAKPKYKSRVVKLFTEAVNEFKDKTMRDELYFKIATEKGQGGRGFAVDDLTVYLGSNISEEEKKQLLDSFYEKCEKAGDKGENVLDGKNMSIAGTRYKDGIMLAGEPDIATLLNKNFSNAKGDFKARFSDRDRLSQIDRISQEQSKDTYSFNSFVTSMLVQSTFIAGQRLGTKLNKAIDTNDPKVREETKRIFRQLCFLNGLNPENMAEIDSKSVFG